MTTKKNLAVIVLNYNDSASTIKYVKSIKKYKVIDKIVVVDNYSPDGSYQKLKKLSDDKIDVICTDENKGYAYGNNYAIRYLNKNYGQYKYIAISNPDVEVSEDAYIKCIDFLDNHSKVAIAAPRMYDINDKPHPLSGWKLRSLRGDTIDSSLLLTEIFQKSHMECYPSRYLNQDVAYVDCVAGSFFIIKHSIFKKVNYFDENTFLYFEEDILGNKLKKAGYQNVILNNCKFKHYESVSVDKNMNFLKKYNNLQKSKKYYHKNYNEACNTKSSSWKLLILDFFTYFRKFEEVGFVFIKKLKIDKIYRKIRGIFSNGFLLKLTKLLLLILNIILYPIFFICKKLRKRENVLYFSVVTWKWIKQRPHFVALELVKSGNYKVDYRYQTLYSKYMPDDNGKMVKNKVEKIKYFRIKPFKILPANTRFRTRFNSIWSVIRTSFWDYDKIILTQPNQIDFFFMRVHKLRGTKIYYECMDNYEGWENDVDGFRDKQGRLISVSDHIIVTADKLKKKLIDLYDCKDKITVVRNGYDHNLFENFKKIKTNLNHPNIVYIGTIDDWFDFESVVQFAKNNKKFNIDIIGPINDGLKTTIGKIKEKNIYFHGPIEHNLVPQYICDSDVLIIPFIVNDIIEYVDPVKIYEYLYMKKPVVTTYWKELDQFKDIVYFYDGPEDFDKQIKLALQSQFKETKKYKNIIFASKWEERLKEYIKVIK